MQTGQGHTNKLDRYAVTRSRELVEATCVFVDLLGGLDTSPSLPVLRFLYNWRLSFATSDGVHFLYDNNDVATELRRK